MNNKSVKDLVNAWNFYCDHNDMRYRIYTYEELKELADKCDISIGVIIRLKSSCYEFNELYFIHNAHLRMYVGYTPFEIRDEINSDAMNKWYLNIKYGMSVGKGE